MTASQKSNDMDTNLSFGQIAVASILLKHFQRKKFSLPKFLESSHFQKCIYFSKHNMELVGGFNPIEKYDRQNGNLPQFSG